MLFKDEILYRITAIIWEFAQNEFGFDQRTVDNIRADVGSDTNYLNGKLSIDKIANSYTSYFIKIFLKIRKLYEY